MTIVRLALGGSRARVSRALGLDTPLARPPAVLVSYVYLRSFYPLMQTRKIQYRDWIMDSGAFSVYKSGKQILLADYIKICTSLLKEDRTLTDVICLDAINDPKQSLVNFCAMSDAGVKTIPVFHIGEDFGLLAEYCSRAHLVGLSCRFGESVKQSTAFYERCFSRCWPKRFHSFGWTAKAMLLRFPFFGEAIVGYLPQGKVVGVSKLVRLVDCFAHRLQIQERLTNQIAQAMELYLQPLGVGVIIKAHHMCMSCRGVRRSESQMITSALYGALRENAACRAEFMELKQ